MKHTVTLQVHQSLSEDVYHDRVRIPEIHRGGLKEGRVCKISVNGKAGLFEVRGLLGDRRPIIRISDKDRKTLGDLKFLESCDFTIRTVGWFGQFHWAWNASDSAARIAARLGLLGVVLGAVSLVPILYPGIIGLFQWLLHRK